MNGILMGNEKQKVGKWGEELASVFLINKCYKIIARNVRTPYGEIDILAIFNNNLVFIEVKTRTNKIFGNPEIALTPRKLLHMEKSALYYIQNIDYEGGWQLDAISILKIGENQPEIVHFENVSP
jgi:putative endonuclease